jgi:hypothetical protein
MSRKSPFTDGSKPCILEAEMQWKGGRSHGTAAYGYPVGAVVYFFERGNENVHRAYESAEMAK